MGPRRDSTAVAARVRSAMVTCVDKALSARATRARTSAAAARLARGSVSRAMCRARRARVPLCPRGSKTPYAPEAAKRARGLARARAASRGRPGRFARWTAPATRARATGCAASLTSLRVPWMRSAPACGARTWFVQLARLRRTARATHALGADASFQGVPFVRTKPTVPAAHATRQRRFAGRASEPPALAGPTARPTTAMP